jgi:hypothetical protein
MNEQEKSIKRAELINKLTAVPPVQEGKEVEPMTQAQAPEKESKRKDIGSLLTETLNKQIRKDSNKKEIVDEKRKDFASVDKARLNNLLKKLGK